jgi:hypothetical protein
LLDALPAGSYLAMSHLSGEFDPRAWDGVAKVYAERGMVMRVRSKAEIERFFSGLDLVEPGVRPSAPVAARQRSGGPAVRRGCGLLRRACPQGLTARTGTTGCRIKDLYFKPGDKRCAGIPAGRTPTSSCAKTR